MGWLRRKGIVIDLFENSCILPKAVGVYPFVTRGTHIKVSVPLVLYNASMIACLLALDFHLIRAWNSPPLSGKTIFVVRLIRTAQLAMTTATIAASSLWLLRNKMNVEELLIELLRFEDTIQLKTLCICNRWLVFTLGILPLLAILNFVMEKESEILLRTFVSVRFLIASLMIFSTSGFFSRCTKILETAYQGLINQLNNLGRVQSLKDIQKATEHLVSGGEALNKVFGLQMLCITSSSFVIITGNIYLAITSADVGLLIMCVIWIMTFTMLMLHIISNCNSLVEKAKELDKEFYRVLLDGTNGDLSLQVRSCLHYSNKREIKFSACGFFTLDYSLAGSMVASAATYLVILIQIGDVEKLGDSHTAVNPN